jgi:pantetheine-phosphate adenylyltransferase
MNKIGVVAGSFDPITYGHTWLFQRAVELVDQLYVVVGINAAKRHMFTPEERVNHVREVIDDMFGATAERIIVTTVSKQLLIDYVATLGDGSGGGNPLLVRGIRTTDDFSYEHQLQLINKKLQPHIDTAFFIPPRDLTEVSSSTVKSLAGYDGWEGAISSYVHPKTIELLKGKLG